MKLNPPTGVDNAGAVAGEAGAPKLNPLEAGVVATDDAAPNEALPKLKPPAAGAAGLAGAGLPGAAAGAAPKLKPPAGDEVEPKLILLMRANHGNAELRADIFRSAGVVQMAVSEPHLFYRHAQLFRRRQKLLMVAARIDENTLHSLAVPHQAAILLKRRHRKYLDVDRRVGSNLCHTPLK